MIQLKFVLDSGLPQHHTYLTNDNQHTIREIFYRVVQITLLGCRHACISDLTLLTSMRLLRLIMSKVILLCVSCCNKSILQCSVGVCMYFLSNFLLSH